MTRPTITDPRPSYIRARDARDRRSAIRVVAVGMVVTFRECGVRDYRRIQITGFARHHRPLVAELTVAVLVERVGRNISSPVVHAHYEHLRHIAARIGRVHSPARIS